MLIIAHGTHVSFQVLYSVSTMHVPDPSDSLLNVFFEATAANGSICHAELSQFKKLAFLKIMSN